MDATFSRYSSGLNNFPLLTLMLPFFRTGPDNFSVLARIPPFVGTRLDSNTLGIKSSKTKESDEVVANLQCLLSFFGIYEMLQLMRKHKLH